MAKDDFSNQPIVNHIYCYYEDIGGNEVELLKLWYREWERQGWLPRVLTKDEGQHHPKYHELIAAAYELPTVNNKAFEISSFARWAAFAQIDGAVADYDVFPREPYPPRPFPGFYTADPCGGPGFVVGTKQDFEVVVDTIINYQPRPNDVCFGRPHVSDMSVLQNSKVIYDTVAHDIECYGREGWETKPLVHFGNAYLSRKLPKAVEIKEILNL